jgi:hypothetical protein
MRFATGLTGFVIVPDNEITDPLDNPHEHDTLGSERCQPRTAIDARQLQGRTCQAAEAPDSDEYRFNAHRWPPGKRILSFLAGLSSDFADALTAILRDVKFRLYLRCL